ncbi:hypothetical protein Hanom_Chr08g00747241 [Helianthus anomalus]
MDSRVVGSYIQALRWVDRLSGLDEKVDAIVKQFDEFLEIVIDEHVKKGVGLSGEA